MVADIIQFNSSDAEYIGVCDAIQGHVSQSITQQFKLERRRDLAHARLSLDCREYLIRDQFTNLYCCFAADLIDGERHVVVNFVGSETRGLNKKFAHYNTFSDEMLKFLQNDAWVLFGRQTVAIQKGRLAASQPVVLA